MIRGDLYVVRVYVHKLVACGAALVDATPHAFRQTLTETEWLLSSVEKYVVGAVRNQGLLTHVG
jgi:hypothetical protein